MLSLLSTLKLRLSIPDTDTTNDALLTSALQAVSTRFDKETNRTLARAVDFKQEFDITDTEIAAACYPIENVTKFEIKRTESEGWVEQPDTEFLVRSSCIISLQSRFSIQPLAFSLARITYTGGFVLPGTDFPPAQIRLTPTSFSSAMNGGAQVSVGGDAINIASWKFTLVFGPEGTLTYYCRSD